MVLLWTILGWLLSFGVIGMADNLPNMPVSLRRIRAWLLPRCGYCGASRRLTDLSPALSLLLRAGGCAHCGGPRPMRDHLAEAGMTLVIPGLWLAGLLSGGAGLVLLQAGLLAFCLVMVIVDFEHRMVLGEIVLAAVLLAVLNGVLLGWEWAAQVLLGGAVGFGALLILYLIGRGMAWMFRLGVGAEPLGFGDVWIAGFVGLLVGWPSILFALIFAIFVGGSVGLLIMAARLFRRESVLGATMAYGPYLLLAGVLVRWFGSHVAGYLR